jgi:hypothetical protein
MYGKMGVASGAVAAGALLASGQQMVAWAILGSASVVLAGIMLYRLATIKARR